MCENFGTPPDWLVSEFAQAFADQVDREILQMSTYITIAEVVFRKRNDFVKEFNRREFSIQIFMSFKLWNKMMVEDRNEIELYHSKGATILGFPVYRVMEENFTFLVHVDAKI